MTLTECKNHMRIYLSGADIGIDWQRAAARWSLRYKWENERADNLQEKLDAANARAERAEAALAKLQEESNALCNHILDDSIFGCESNQPCVWNRFMAGNDSWYVSTTCRETMYWNSGDKPGEGYKFCPYCGHSLSLRPTQ